VSRYRDWNDNAVHHFTIVSFHDRIEVGARSLVHTDPTGPGLAAATDRPGEGPEPPYTLYDFLQFGGPVRNSAALRAFAQGAHVAAGATLGEQVAAYGRHIRAHMTYKKHVTRYDSTTDDVLEIRSGVCQDFTHLMLGPCGCGRFPAGT
jgi:transglutaminase-like putative cysteine protease